MPRETRYDSRDINPAELSFDPLANPVADPYPHTSTCNNFVLSPDGALTSRAPFIELITPNATARYPVRVWEYSTLPKNGVIYRYLIASVRNYPTTSPEIYRLYYSFYSYDSLGGTTIGPTAGWTAFTSLRDCNASSRAHILTISRGRAYIKAFPDSASSEKLGTIVFDANDDPLSPDIYPWGMPSPTVPARTTGDVTKLSAAATATDTTLNVTSTTGFPASGELWLNYEKVTYGGVTATSFTGVTRGVNGTDAQTHDLGTIVLGRDGWTASDHRVDVNKGWYYAYAWKSITGQLSNRSDIERNPDLMPSFTGPFFDLCPQVTVQGHADTTNIPKIVIFRSTDGGGTFYFLEEITNTGAGNITYEDDSFGTGGSSSTFNDPIPDAKLDTGYVAPSLTTNSPPPTVNAPLVVGADAPSKSVYAIETYLGRIFYPIDNYLYFSSREELREGVGEESFVSGNSGNFIIFNELITGLASTFEALYIGTTDGVYKLTGTSRETFQVLKISSISVWGGDEKQCMVAADQDVYFVSFDGGMFFKISNDVVEHISPLLNNTQGSKSCQLMYYRSQRYELLIWASNGGKEDFDALTSVWSIYDIQASRKQKRHIWTGQWSRLGSTCAGLARQQGGTVSILSGVFNQTAEKWTITYMASPTAPNTGGCNDERINDAGNTVAVTNSPLIVIAGIAPPAGNHINLANLPTRYVKFGRVYVYSYEFGTYLAPTSIACDLDHVAVSGGAPIDSPRVPQTQPFMTIQNIPIDRSGYAMTSLMLSLSDTSKSLAIFRIIVEMATNYSAVP